MTPYDIYITILIAISSISIASSLLVLVTFLLFHELRDKFFMRMIAFISIADMFGNLPYLLPYRPEKGNWWCWIQGVLNITAYPMGWLWTLVLLHFMYCIIADGRLPGEKYYIYAHILCWGLPIVLTSFSFIFSGYGPQSDRIDYEVCAEVGKSGQYYHAFTYYVLL